MRDATHERTAVIAARSTDPPVETTEIEDLIAACGYDVAGVLTQTGPEDSGTYLGRGNVRNSPRPSPRPAPPSSS